MSRMQNVEGTIPKRLIIGWRYHVAGWKTGANFVLDSINDEWATLSYPKKHWKSIRVHKDLLRNTYRHRKHTAPPIKLDKGTSEGK